MIPYIENSKDIQKLLENLMNSIWFQNTKQIFRNLLHFYTPIINDQKEKLNKQSHLQLH